MFLRNLIQEAFSDFVEVDGEEDRCVALSGSSPDNAENARRISIIFRLRLADRLHGVHGGRSSAGSIPELGTSQRDIPSAF